MQKLKESILCDNTIHVEKTKGSPLANYEYCTKAKTRVGEIYEYGTAPFNNQGKRTDIINFTKAVLEGESEESIIENYPRQYCTYTKAYDKLKAIRLKTASNQFRHLEVEVIVGPTGCGKTRHVFDTHGYDKVYKLEQDGSSNVWWDGYEGQDVLLIDDFYGWIKPGFLLNVLDGYPLRLPIKGSHVYANYTKVYITSNVSVTDWYTNIPNNVKDALLRRINKVTNHYLT